MAGEPKRQEQVIQLVLGPAVGLLVFLFSLTEVYERAELVTYDSRFNMRTSVFGAPPINPNLGTIDIDEESIQHEGRYQDWTRDKYTDVVRLLDRYGARLIGFDIFFLEPSTKLVSEEQIRSLPRIDAGSIDALLARSDYDEMFRRAIGDAGNVYLGQTLVVAHGEEDGAGMERSSLSQDQRAALDTIRARSPRLMVDPKTSELRQAFDFSPPVRALREAARGFAYAQTVPDVDGARRRYPLVYQYEDVVFPSMALAMACDILQVPITAVEVWPGDCVRLPGAHMADGSVRDLEVPIDDFGNMHVNWTGRFRDTFNHYPHMALRRASARADRQALLDDIKRFVADDPSLNEPKRLVGPVLRAGYKDRDVIFEVFRVWAQIVGIDAALTANPDLTGQSFWKSNGVDVPDQNQEMLFDQLRLTRLVAERLVADPEIASADLVAALPEHDPVLVRQSEEFVRGILIDGAVPSTARPLFFFPYERYEARDGHSAFISPADVAGKVLFYGLTAPGTHDINVTPVQGNYPMVGIYPNVLSTILEGQFIRRMPPWSDALLILALGVLLSLVIPGLRVLTGAVLVLCLVVFYTLVVFFTFTHAGLRLEFVAPLTTLIAGYLALTIYGYVIKEKEKEFVQGAFGHYLSPAVVDQIMTNPDMVNQLGGEERVMTAFFSDIASFTTISESFQPAGLVAFINSYLSEMCDIIEEYGGTIDKFEGDAIVGFFGAPVYYDDHAVRGCLACVDQQRRMIEVRERWARDTNLPQALQQLRAEWEGAGRVFCHVRMGLTAGPMVVGNMGSKTRNDYTMMGDTVNLAARFESGQKIYGTGIMVNDAIYEAVKDQVETRRLDVILVVGKEEPVTAYEVLDRKGQLSQTKADVLALFQEGLDLYDRFEFSQAHKVFLRAAELDPSDGPSELYADRCEDFAENPPEDLIFRAQSK